MNLTTDRWIPALRADGTRSLFSLRELFDEAHALRDLAVKPHERVAMMRLLICITQAALDGPADEVEWQESRQKIQPRVRTYLDKWAAGFELFGDGPRFLQFSDLKPGKEDDEGNAATKLDLTLATGNNSTLFDNQAGQGRSVDPARSALNLLSFQCFSPGGRIGVARWNRQDTPGKGASNHAPCTPSSMLHAMILGPTLLDTLAHNLISKNLVVSAVAKGWGRPVWEMPVCDLSDAAAVQNATLTYLGRLVPYSRAIRLQDAGGTIILGNGLNYPIFPAYRELMATVVIRKDEPKLLSASTSRSIWRQLSSITVKRRADSDPTAGPLALNLNSCSKETVLWIGALVTATNAKILDIVEAVYSIPPQLFDPAGRIAYEMGVRHAESMDSALGKAVGAYSASLKIDGPPYERARQHFWTSIEQNLSALFAVARELTPAEKIVDSAWGRAVRAAATEAYERSCPRRTARQIEAYALGLRYLYSSNQQPAKFAKKTKSSV